MKQSTILVPEFVEFMPPVLENGIIYISMIYATAVHKCCCGCGEKVVTPLSPTDWKLTFDGVSVSLDPSIGNWSFTCKSHYFIRRNRVVWAPRWSQEQIDAGRARDRVLTEQYFDSVGTEPGLGTEDDLGKLESGKGEKGFWGKLKKWWSRGSGGRRNSPPKNG